MHSQRNDARAVLQVREWTSSSHLRHLHVTPGHTTTESRPLRGLWQGTVATEAICAPGVHVIEVVYDMRSAAPELIATVLKSSTADADEPSRAWSKGLCNEPWSDDAAQDAHQQLANLTGLASRDWQSALTALWAGHFETPSAYLAPTGDVKHATVEAAVATVPAHAAHATPARPRCSSGAMSAESGAATTPPHNSLFGTGPVPTAQTEHDAELELTGAASLPAEESSMEDLNPGTPTARARASSPALPSPAQPVSRPALEWPALAAAVQAAHGCVAVQWEHRRCPEEGVLFELRLGFGQAVDGLLLVSEGCQDEYQVALYTRMPMP